MTLNLTLQIMIAALAGGIAALLYFGGLWLTVRRINQARRALPYLAVSAAIRLGFIVAAVMLAILAGADARHLLAALAGFLTVRQIIIFRARRSDLSAPWPPKV